MRPVIVIVLATVAFLLIVDIFLGLTMKTQPNSAETISSAATTCPTCPNKPLESSNGFKEPTRKANAAIVILCRNSDLDGLKQSLTQFEDRFNKKFKYPYVFLNEVEFTAEFKAGVKELISTSAEFGFIPNEQWSYPKWVDVAKADKCRADMERNNVIYGGSLSYRHMCRYNSGFFFRHPLLDKYEYYWRIEPSVDFTCDINYDPFLFMQDNNKSYGFTIMLPEFVETIPTLWDTTKKFMNNYPQYIHPRNVLKELFMNSDGSYNLCHFWSNFEIASLKFLRSDAYLKYFDYLDHAGGFFYERWGDAPVHSLAVGMFLPKEQIHYFEDVGYYHAPYGNCPSNPALNMNCQCDSSKSVNWNNSCQSRYVRLSYP